MRYVIVAPLYVNCSAGIRALYELQKRIILAGKDAICVSHFFEIEDDDIVVYPEIVPGNPFKGKRVIRWVLNTPGELGGDLHYAPTEKVVTWSTRYMDAPVLRIPVMEPFFRDEHNPNRSGAAVWVGKGNRPGPRTDKPVEPPETCQVITYRWPKRRRELAKLLNSVCTFYTYDNKTALADEARACGCAVKQIHPDGSVTDYDHDDSFDPNDVDSYLQTFLNLYSEEAVSCS